MFPIPPDEHLVEERVCKHCSVVFPITDKDMEFYEKVSPVFGGKRYTIPAPTLCPDCRQQRRLSFRNERKLYKRKCDATGKDIISIYSPDKPYTVYHQDYWWSDKWNPLDYGREFDFSRSAFEQMGELMRGVPFSNTSRENCENSDYGNFLTNGKNCYLTFNGSGNQDCYYSTYITNSSDIFDSLYIQNSTHTYNSIYINSCSNVSNSLNCENSSFLKYSVNCKDCTHCILCTNLYNKSYHINNISYEKEEYEKKSQEILRNEEYLKNSFTKLCRTAVRPHNIIRSCETVLGDILYDSTEIKNSFEVYGSENISYSQRILFSKNCMDVTLYGLNSNFGYELHNCGSNFYQNIFCSLCYTDNNYLSYCINCSSSTHLFLCSGLRNKSYCILNKQYTKEQYEELVPRIIEHMMKTGEWGEFFPSTLSPFGYNETVAQEYFPLSRDSVIPVSGSSVIARNHSVSVNDDVAIQVPESLDRHTSFHSARDDGTTETETFLHGTRFNWSDYEAPFPQVDKIIPAEKLPENIDDIPDDILNWAIECEVTKKPFRIIRQELEFYRKHHLPIPRRHPDQRHLDRLALRNPRKLFERLCDCEKCEENHRQRGVYKEEGFFLNPKTGTRTKKMITTYSPERPERVYCEVCYEREVVG